MLLNRFHNGQERGAVQEHERFRRRGTNGVGQGGGQTGQEVDAPGDVAVRGRDADAALREAVNGSPSTPTTNSDPYPTPTPAWPTGSKNSPALFE
jgi:hypothetical protein